jgi:hypothetical protein
MARKTAIIHITAEGRDLGKVFHIQEMSAPKGERWASHTLMGMVQAGVDIPEEYFKTGMAGLAAVGFKALLTIPSHIADPLLDQMMTCVTIITDPKNPAFMRALIDDDIEEIQTILKLRSDIFELHTGFSVAGFLSRLISRAPADEDEQSTTQTSTPSSETSSPVA